MRSWKAAEEWLSWSRFHALLHVTYNPLINCDSWRVASPVIFPSERFDRKAVQAVEVRAAPRRQAAVQSRSLVDTTSGTKADEGISCENNGSTAALRSYTYTFCLEREDNGPFKVWPPWIGL